MFEQNVEKAENADQLVFWKLHQIAFNYFILVGFEVFEDDGSEDPSIFFFTKFFELKTRTLIFEDDLE